MSKNTIQEQFRAAAKHFEEVYKKDFGRGFQVRVSEKSGVRSSYFNEILKGKKDGPEEVRRKLVDGIGLVCDKAEGITYEIFLDLGQYILTNGTSTGWQSPLREIITKFPKEGVTAPPVDKNMQLISDWINQQDVPGDMWIFLKVLLARESPEFNLWLKTIREKNHLDQCREEKSAA